MFIGIQQQRTFAYVHYSEKANWSMADVSGPFRWWKETCWEAMLLSSKFSTIGDAKDLN